MKYDVKIKLSFSGVVEIEADSPEEAEAKAEELYRNKLIMENIDENEYYDGIEEICVIN